MAAARVLWPVDYTTCCQVASYDDLNGNQRRNFQKEIENRLINLECCMLTCLGEV